MFHICWTMDCESCHPGVNDPDLGRRAVRGFTDVLNQFNWKASLFSIPEEVAPLEREFKVALEHGHEIGLHTHPLASGEPVDFLGAFSFDAQVKILRKGLEKIKILLGKEPVSFRPGYASANDSTFPALAECGIRQCSASMPGRMMSNLASNWAGAPLFVHYAHSSNRFLTGSMDLVELPISVDWESLIWGGRHPQDLRIEFTDAKNHSFLIRKIMRRQIEEKLPFCALVILTHNLFHYDDPANFRRETMLGMIESIRMYADEFGVETAGITIGEAARAFRETVPIAPEIAPDRSAY